MNKPMVISSLDDISYVLKETCDNVSASVESYVEKINKYNESNDEFTLENAFIKK